ncbi:hypothetical protein [Nitrosomonas ureae]|uniref:Surface antigen n=1 Tax=Nitrosomonas ureae TaxID=44577 RepID=A0A1H9FGX9_9PROT|nr:hypothetical protein [Nitrosomonas ureae]SEQ37186.1 hypothetical protein SAMN05421510_104311 [Nitrosomonas ureae]
MNRKASCAMNIGTSLLIVASLGGCSALQQNHLVTGVAAVAGGGIGNRIGDSIGGKNSEWIGTGLGIIIGGFLGNEIAKYLDERDRESAAKATQDALNKPVPDTTAGDTSEPTIAWKSDHNQDVSGHTKIVKISQDTAGRECRVAEEVAYVGGREIKEQVNFCRDQNSGAWGKAQ